MELIFTFIKSLPIWLMHVTEVLLITLVTATVIVFLVGFLCAFKIVGSRANSIKEIGIFPPRILFSVSEDESPDA
jgi:hypothetical protein